MALTIESIQHSLFSSFKQIALEAICHRFNFKSINESLNYFDEKYSSFKNNIKIQEHEDHYAIIKDITFHEDDFFNSINKSIILFLHSEYYFNKKQIDTAILYSTYANYCLGTSVGFHVGMKYQQEKTPLTSTHFSNAGKKTAKAIRSTRCRELIIKYLTDNISIKKWRDYNDALQDIIEMLRLEGEKDKTLYMRPDRRRPNVKKWNHMNDYTSKSEIIFQEKVAAIFKNSKGRQ
ncbi:MULTISPECIES: hypothetical protein [Providencia]|uniref:hypothetical protein n=1 Tax=Providencia TaxID=586 RepID=UPI00234ACBA5|nr:MULTISPECIES: hypothetical protein [unclassified Providencia]